MIICNTAVMIEDMKWNKKTADKRISNMRKIASELKIRIMQNETFFGENCDIKELAELVEKKWAQKVTYVMIYGIYGMFCKKEQLGRLNEYLGLILIYKI